MFLDLLHPANQKFFRFFSEQTCRSLSESPDRIGDQNCYGVHPDLLYHFWEDVPLRVPQSMAWMVCGQPAFVNPKSGVVLGVAVGSIGYAVRVTERILHEAIALGVTQEFDIQGDRGRSWDFRLIGDDWIVSSRLAVELELEQKWCHETWKAFEFPRAKSKSQFESSVQTLAKWLDEIVVSSFPTIIQCDLEEEFERYQPALTGLQERGFSIERTTDGIHISVPGRRLRWHRENSERPDMILVSGLEIEQVKRESLQAADDSRMDEEGVDHLCELVQLPDCVAVVFREPVNPIEFFWVLSGFRESEASRAVGWYVSPNDLKSYFISLFESDEDYLLAVSPNEQTLKVCMIDGSISPSDEKIEYEEPPELEPRIPVMQFSLKLEADERSGNTKFEVSLPEDGL